MSIQAWRGWRFFQAAFINILDNCQSEQLNQIWGYDKNHHGLLIKKVLILIAHAVLCLTLQRFAALGLCVYWFRWKLSWLNCDVQKKMVTWLICTDIQNMNSVFGNCFSVCTIRWATVFGNDAQKLEVNDKLGIKNPKGRQVLYRILASHVHGSIRGMDPSSSLWIWDRWTRVQNNKLIHKLYGLNLDGLHWH